MAGQLPVDLKLLLEAYDVGQQYQKLSKHGVTTIDQFAVLSAKRLHDLGINDFNVRFRALPKAQTLVNSVWQRDAIKQDLLVSTDRYRRQGPCLGYKNSSKTPKFLPRIKPSFTSILLHVKHTNYT